MSHEDAAKPTTARRTQTEEPICTKKRAGLKTTQINPPKTLARKTAGHEESAETTQETETVTVAVTETETKRKVNEIDATEIDDEKGPEKDLMIDT